MGVFGRGGSLSIDVAVTEREVSGPERGKAYSGSFSLSGSSLRVFGMGRFWIRGERRALTLAPGVAITLGPVTTRLRYQGYQTAGLTYTTSHLAELSLDIGLGRGLRATLGLSEQWGTTSQGTRLRTSISKSF
jgi:hypothetical protein